MKHLMIIALILVLSLPLLAEELEGLLKIRESGVQNADLYYNLGVGYWQKGENAEATLCFLRALNLDSAHKPAKENLEYLKSSSKDRELYPEYSYLQRVFLAGWAFMNLNRMALLCLLLLGLVALSFAWLRFYDPDKETGLPELVLGLALLLFLLAACAAGYKAYHQRNNALAVVLQDDVQLREGPGQDEPRVAVINEGLIVKVLKEKQAGVLVKLPNGGRGWMHRDDCVRVVSSE